MHMLCAAWLIRAYARFRAGMVLTPAERRRIEKINAPALPAGGSGDA
jgi:hypothetical protein